jgi:hypothetical protein
MSDDDEVVPVVDEVPDVTLTTVQLAFLSGASYRQLNYWTRKGWLNPDGGVGTGNVAHWSLAESFTAVRMATLVGVGVSPTMAARVARAARS